MQKLRILKKMVLVASITAGLATTSAGAPGPRGDQPPGQDRPGRPPLPCGKICGIEVVTNVELADNEKNFLDVVAHCPPGKVVLGGGVLADGDIETVNLHGNRPHQSLVGNVLKLTGWEGNATQLNPDFDGEWGMAVHAICATVE